MNDPEAPDMRFVFVHPEHRRRRHALVRGAALLAVCLWPAQSPADEFDSGLLWKIDNGSSTPSYILGTMHVEDPRVTQLPAPVQRAFEDSDSLTTEALLDLEQILAVGTELLILDGGTLEGLIGSELNSRVEAALRDRGFPAEIATVMKPWAVALLLSQPPPRSGMFLDRKLYQMARQNGKTVYGLESMSEQLTAFKNMSTDDQIELLKETLDNLDRIPGLIEDLIQAYLDRDLHRLAELADQQFAPSPAQEQLKLKLLNERNQTMVERMQPRLEEGNAFIAIGALHLAGSDGVLSRLDRRGFSVTRVY